MTRRTFSPAELDASIRVALSRGMPARRGYSLECGCFVGVVSTVHCWRHDPGRLLGTGASLPTPKRDEDWRV